MQGETNRIIQGLKRGLRCSDFVAVPVAAPREHLQGIRLRPQRWWNVLKGQRRTEVQSRIRSRLPHRE